MKTISRLISILLLTMMIITAPLLSFATEEEPFNASGTGNVLTGTDNSYAEDSEPDHEDAEASADVIISNDEPTEVTVVDSVLELTEESEAAYENDAFFSIDAANDDSADLATDDVSEDVTDILSGGESVSLKQEEIIETLEDSGLYMAEESGKNKVDVTSMFAYQRLRLVAPHEAEINAYGATKAVYFEDSYLLSYDSMEATMLAYDALVSEYGEDSVFIDLPVKVSGTAFGWGTSFMRMNNQKILKESKARVTVAVIDSGIQRSHPVFKGKTILQGVDIINKDRDPSDDFGHGTQVCGIIAESTPSNVRILPVKAMNSRGEGSLESIVNAVRYAEEQGADVINMSLCGYLYKSSEMQLYENRFKKYKALIVCAAGNESENMDAPGVMQFPGELSSTVCVGAITASKKRSSFSNYGRAVDFAAPGESLMLARWRGSYSVDSGTSFSSPYVASAAALVKAAHPKYTKSQIRNYLKSISEDMGKKGKDVYFGYGCPRFPEDPNRPRGGKISGSGVRYTVTDIKKKTYNGSAQTQRPCVIVNGEILKQGVDYVIKYRNNVNAGTAKMTIIGKGSFSGEIKGITFRINPKRVTPTVTLSKRTFPWTNKVQTPVATVYYGKQKLPASRYSLSYSAGRKNVGTYGVTVTMKGNYTGSTTATYSIIPRGAGITFVKGEKNAISLKWATQSKKMSTNYIRGYQAQVATDSAFTKNVKTVPYLGYKNTINTVRNLAANKKYYVRTRTYMTVGNNYYFSGWSEVKTVKTK